MFNATPPVHPNCVLPGQEVWCPDVLGATKALYDGWCVEFAFANGGSIAVTENHPVLTPVGFLPASALDIGDDVLHCTDPQRVADAINPHDANAPSLIEDVFRALDVACGVPPACMETASEDFHGDAASFVGKVNVVFADSFLMRKQNARRASTIGHEALCRAGEFPAANLTGNSPSDHGFKGVGVPAPGGVSACYLCGSLVRGHSGPLRGFGGGLPTRGNPTVLEPSAEYIAADAALTREFVLRFASFIASEKIVGVRRFWCRTHVYDLQAEMYGLYICNGVIVHNCRCVIGPDDVWTDAGDARVCLYCMTLGASWNLKLDTPPNDQEIADLLDKDGHEAFRKAVERDSGVADAVIKDAAQKATGGIVIDITPGAGETYTVAIEREATRKLAEARAAASIKPGTFVPGIGEVTEGIIFEPAPFGRKRPALVSVVIAETPTHNVIRKMGRYYVRTAGGKVVASDDNLALALLILLALAERERRKREERARSDG